MYQGSQSKDDPLIYLSLAVMVPGAVLMTLGSLFMLFIPISQGLFGYIKISSDGLEFRRFPFRTHKFKWESVERISQGTVSTQIPFMRGPLRYGSLLIRRDTPGWETNMGNGRLGSANYHGIPISEFQGWDDGSLLENLKLYAPHISMRTGLTSLEEEKPAKK